MLVLAAKLTSESSWFEIVFTGGGIIGYVIWVLSFLMVGLVIQSFISIRKSNIHPPDAEARLGGMLDNAQYREAIDATVSAPDFYSYVLHAALTDAGRGYAAMERAMEEAGEERMGKLLRSIEWLNLLGNIGPLMGLLGTVQGMIEAFFDLVRKGGSPSAADLAGSVGIALICTMLGLTLAIPALSVFFIQRVRIDGICSGAMLAAQQMIQRFRPGAKPADA